MNDRFKFRVWNKAAEKFVERFILSPDDGICIISDKCKTYVKGNPNYILMQSTGLHDKNGKLIYEGDILKINTWLDKIVPDDFEYRYENEKGFALYQIFFNQEKARFEAKCIKYTKEKPYRCFLLEYVPTNNEVIGNIHTDAHLLEEYKDE